jgi:hypothetical protein
MDRQMEIGNYKVTKVKPNGRNVFKVAIRSLKRSKLRTIETDHSFTEWSDSEAENRYNSLIDFARNNS